MYYKLCILKCETLKCKACYMKKYKRVIVIDDDPLIHMSCEMALLGSKYQKTSIQDVDEAVAYPKSKNKYEKPDIILMDQMLGYTYGTDIICTMRKDKYFDDIPIILHTGYADKIANSAILKKLNILHVLLKPASKEQLLKCLNIYIDYFKKNEK